jgi:hypothetical protein
LNMVGSTLNPLSRSEPDLQRFRFEAFNKVRFIRRTAFCRRVRAERIIIRFGRPSISPMRKTAVLISSTVSIRLSPIAF